MFLGRGEENRYDFGKRDTKDRKDRQGGGMPDDGSDPGCSACRRQGDGGTGDYQRGN